MRMYRAFSISHIDRLKNIIAASPRTVPPVLFAKKNSGGIAARLKMLITDL